MTAISIRLRDDADRAIVEGAKRATGERTAAKALMRSARDYPEMVTELRRLREELSAARERVREARALVEDWDRAQARESAARRALLGLLE